MGTNNVKEMGLFYCNEFIFLTQASFIQNYIVLKHVCNEIDKILKYLIKLKLQKIANSINSYRNGTWMLLLQGHNDTLMLEFPNCSICVGMWEWNDFHE